MKNKIIGLMLVFVCIFSLVGCNSKVLEKSGLKIIKTFSARDRFEPNGVPTNKYMDTLLIVAKNSDNFDPYEVTEERVLELSKEVKFPSKYCSLMVFIMPEDFNDKEHNMEDMDVLFDNCVYLFNATDYTHLFLSTNNDNPEEFWYGMSDQSGVLFEGCINKSRIK